MNWSCQHAIAVLVLVLGAGPCAAQFTLPSPYEELEEEAAEEQPVEEEPTELVYAGEPLLVPPKCRPQDFLRAGVVCGSSAPCELFLELTQLGQAGDRLFLLGNTHTAAETISTVLLRSEDGGTTWLEPVDRTGAASLEFVYFFDAEHGWIAGQQSEQDYSATPFVLVTNNGGASWRKRKIWGGDEDRSGVVIEMNFDAPGHGFLLVERPAAERDPYELYESMNGGLSWSIRRISNTKPRLRRIALAPAPSDYRLREDESSGTYEIERRESGSWSRVASFAVQMGACGSMEAKIPFHAEAEP